MDLRLLSYKGKFSKGLCSGIFFLGIIFLLFHVVLTSSKFPNINGTTQQDSEVNLTGTLAHRIHLSQTAISNWNTSTNLLARGIVLGEVKNSDLDSVITKMQLDDDWKGVLSIKRYSELLNYSSQIIDEGVKWALDKAPMFKSFSLPITQSDGYFWMWYQYVLFGYRYSRELDYLTDKWNAASAFEGLRNCRITNGRAFYECNPDTNDTHFLHGTRWMSTANLANCFMILYKETGIQEAFDFALQEWDDLNNYYWSESKKAYDYSRTWKTWEWSGIEVFFNYEKLRELNETLTNWDRVYVDLQHRYLVDLWNSPLWGDKVVVHSEGALQKRLRGTLDAWMMLSTYFGKFSLSNQMHMQDLLEGKNDIKAWQALISSDAELYNPQTFKFKLDSDAVDYTDYATAEGCVTLFLMGMSPQNGSGLMIPKRCHDYSGEPFPADQFRFIYSNQEITIPVYGGTSIKFLFGSDFPTYTFTEDGLYRLTFTPDWNSIISVEQITTGLPGTSSTTNPTSSSSVTSPSVTTSFGTTSSPPSTIISSNLPSSSSTAASSSSSSTTTHSSSSTSFTQSPSDQQSSLTSHTSKSQTTSISFIGFQSALLLLIGRRLLNKKSQD